VRASGRDRGERSGDRNNKTRIPPQAR
jgi:hypothetical protein